MLRPIGSRHALFRGPVEGLTDGGAEKRRALARARGCDALELGGDLVRKLQYDLFHLDQI